MKKKTSYKRDTPERISLLKSGNTIAKLKNSKFELAK